MSRTTTSLRLQDELREKLAIAAKRERTTVSALIERYVREGLLMEENPGVFFETSLSGDRVARVTGAAKVWQIISDLRRFTGSDSERIAALEEEMGLGKWRFEVAVKYYASNRAEIDEHIRVNDSYWEAQEKLESQREQILG